MFRAIASRAAGAFVIAACLLMPAAVLAQDTEDETGLAPAMAVIAPEGMLTMELNRATDNEAGGCGLVVMTTNRLPQGLTRAAWQVAIFDRDGIVRSLPVLDFGALIPGKTRIGLFQIPDGGCHTIGRIIINDVAECTAEDGSDLRDTCLRALATQSRSDIEFGL
ncbi:MAG: hypothetical protein Q4G25_07455 [Paracoccus sp. (in: a-proteobacteria)]|nr:hypothetical protein [Paracoccus sp. (in: a-proteobacteria)]